MPAVKLKFVESLEQYISILEKLRSKRGKRLWYRGCGKASHTLKPSLYRHIKHQSIDDILILEKELIARFRQRSIPFHSRPLTDEWEWLFLMQHYGVPTRLLDWSESPLMALFFAVTLASHTIVKSGRPFFNGDACIWLLANAKTYEWQPTTGDPVTGPHVTFKTTTAAKVTITGLTSGSRVWARVRAIGTKGIEGPWSDPAMKIVP